MNSFSERKIYHVILKGVNGQELFFEDRDRYKFLELLKQTKAKYFYEIYAYVLMSNHIHLILLDKEDRISQIMHRICMIYAIYFNNKYERTGHLFQNRFKSKNINTERYLITLQRYIHKNPQKDGICKMENYRWSSYQEYLSFSKVVNTEFILNIFCKDNRNIAVKRFIEYNKIDDNDCGVDELEIKKNLTDEEAIIEIKRKLKIENLMLISNLNKKVRNEKIRQINEIRGVSSKQISRILGIHIRTIQRVIKNNVAKAPVPLRQKGEN